VLGFRRQKEKVVWAEREKGIGNAIEIQIKKKRNSNQRGFEIKSSFWSLVKNRTIEVWFKDLNFKPKPLNQGDF
jgi:hypothetical protein